MKTFLLGFFFGMVFSAVALWVVKSSPWAFLPLVKTEVFVLGGSLMGGLFNLLLGSRHYVSSE